MSLPSLKSIVSPCAAVSFACCVLTCIGATAEDHAAGYSEPAVTEEDREHWAFQKPEQADPPQHPFTSWRSNPIDDFIAAELHTSGLVPQPAASPARLLRRVTFDLTGLPPETLNLARFDQDSSPTAYREHVQRLLNSTAYGERWAQHWLDLARFAETDGFELDKTRPNAWKYRDWVINALNRDLPYDEFIRQQIAGDEFAPGNADALNATRFCLSGPDMPDINLTEERRHMLLNEIASTVGSVILGLQLGCAQCHDHKYDPVSQADFYRIRAVFRPAFSLTRYKSVSTFEEASLMPFDARSHVMLRGDFSRPGPEVHPGVIRVAAADGFQLKPSTTTAGTTGRRAALAKWLVSSNNPLTARVIVNRIWQHHFGTGLVDTPSDFGIMGSEPSNYELLDWLACWLMEHDWSLKKLHYLIVTSSAYRQRSLLPADASATERKAWQKTLAVDPDARLLSRYPRRRLEGEAIRDAMLAAAGVLNRQTGGPGVRPPLPAELRATLLKGQWKVSKDPDQHDRRSIYVFARRNLRYPIFEAFDRPAANASCSCRIVSTTAPQSLHLLNSQFSLDVAKRFANRLAADHSDLNSQIENAFLRTLARRPSPQEAEEAAAFVKNHEADDDALTHLCLSLFNCNEFVFPD